MANKPTHEELEQRVKELENEAADLRRAEEWIGRVAAGEDPKFLTNDVTHDPRVHDQGWARKLGLISFAGYRVISTDRKPKSNSKKKWRSASWRRKKRRNFNLNFNEPKS